MKPTTILLAIVVLASAGAPAAAQRRARPPKSVRLYVFDCGTLEGGDTSRFRLKREEMATTDMSVACYLVVHPRGTLAWDAGAVPDTDIKPDMTRYRIVLPNKTERFVTTTQS